MPKLPSIASLLARDPSRWPAGATAAIWRALESDDLQTRRGAAALAHHVADEACVQRLIQLSLSRDLALAEAALSSLGALVAEGATHLPPAQLEKIQRALKQRYHDPGYPVSLRQAALRASAQRWARWHEGAVRAAFLSLEPDWRRCALRAVGCTPALDEALIQALEEAAEEEILDEVIAAVARRRLSGACEALHALLELPRSKGMTLALLHALAALSGAPPRAFLEHPDAEIQRAAKAAMAANLRARPFPPEIEALEALEDLEGEGWPELE